MNIEIKGRAESILKAQVAAGHFATVDEAIEAAVLALAGADDSDLSWAKPHLAVANRQIDAGQILSEDQAFGDLEREFGKL